MEEIISYAETLAIRVIPEFENPGHSRAVGLDPEFREIMTCFNKDTPYPLSGAY